MKICFFSDIQILGGGELWVLNVCTQLSALGHEVAVVCPWRSPLQQHCVARSIEVFCYLRMHGVPLYGPVCHFLERRSFDVVHCTVIGASCEAAILETLVDCVNKRRPGAETALVLKTGLPPMAGLGVGHYGIGSGPAVARLHTVSECNRLAFLEWFRQVDVNVSDDFVTVVREGVHLEKFRVPAPTVALEARRRWRIPEDRSVILCLARLHPMKGQDNLLLALPEVMKQHPD
ncbi:MAG: glycosyltransferase family protein, partial [Planctomycetota bacterium]